MDSVKIKIVAFFAGAAIVLYLVFRESAPSSASTPDGPTSSSSTSVRDGPARSLGASKVAEQGPKKSLEMVFSACDKPEDIEVDIIAIHGLNTNPERSFIAYEKEGDRNSRKVHWLRDPDMLPAKLSEMEPAIPARIFTYTWNANTFNHASDVSFHQHAEALLREIDNARQHTRDKELPIIFIASCYGGLILVKALLLASQPERSTYKSTVDRTSGIMFMGTPFRGSGATTVAMIRVLVKTQILGATASSSLFKVLDEEPGTLKELTNKFVNLAEVENIPMVMIYESGKTNIAKETLPEFVQHVVKSKTEIVLVPEHSACLDGSGESIQLPVKHALLNKFRGPDDQNYQKVAGRLMSLVSRAQHVRKVASVDKADRRIHEEYVSRQYLKIERLSGDLLPMDRCYINLAMVEQSGEGLHGLRDANVGYVSPFSLSARLGVDSPNDKADITLPTLFSHRKMRGDKTRRPSRILVRGRAGMGKTTLCKKMVYDFIYGEMWRDIFKRILWVPLRMLKGRTYPEYNLQNLLFYIYFEKDLDGHHLAEELSRAIDSQAANGLTLFVLDGLDEVSELFDLSHPASDFLRSLLNRPNVIITSRPHAIHVPSLEDLDLELETIGFNQKQIDDYLEITVDDQSRRSEIQSFLDRHELLRSLVRIPIQLDALCFAWGDINDSFNPQADMKTTTSIYQAIEQRLWTKDAVKLEQQTQYQVRDTDELEVGRLVKPERSLLEILAFIGMQNNVINFETKHLKALRKQFTDIETKLSFDKTLSRLSFIRTSDRSISNRNFHFLHLTFQEYFAARYFVRQWKARQPLERLVFGSRKNDKIDPSAFLRKFKHDARYDVFWRFVAGLVHAEGEEETLRFFQTIEQEPRDLLGPTHQRLVMHCLAEVLPGDQPTFADLRTHLEDQLSQWLLFECKFRKDSRLACEMELPHHILYTVLQQASEKVKICLLESLETRSIIVPSSIIDLAISWLGDDNPKNLQIAVLDILESQDVEDQVLRTVKERVKDQDSDVREAAEVFSHRFDVSEKSQEAKKPGSQKARKPKSLLPGLKF